MSFNNSLFLFLFLIFSCSEEQIQLFSEECVECVEYEYSQAYDDTFIILTLEASEYCLGDPILLMPNSGNYWTQLDQELLEIITEAGYCQYLALEDASN